MRIKIPTTEYISIHLMLLFIDVNEILFGPYVLFQYISCYCLSMIGLAKGDDHPVFQYISCYCLSASTASASTISSNFNTSHVTVYQWYYDSRLFTFIDFNTSHVTVYLLGSAFAPFFFAFQYISCYCLSRKYKIVLYFSLYFNTSHVTVYLKHVLSCKTRLYISIHLMLLFIINPLQDIRIVVGFQYISCYCLSVFFKFYFQWSV